LHKTWVLQFDLIIVILGVGLSATPLCVSKKNMKNLNNSIIESILSKELSKGIEDFGDIAIDNLLSDELLKEIPIVKVFVSFYKTTLTIRDLFLIKKILIFLKSINDIPPDKIESFKNEIDNDEKLAQRVGENVILLLDRFNNLNKPLHLAKLFSYFITDKISKSEFDRFSNAIDNLNSVDINTIINTELYNYSEYLHSQLFRAGLAKLNLVGGSNIQDNIRRRIGTVTELPVLKFNLTELGCKFINILKDESIK